MPVYGLSEDGFLPKSLTVIRDELNAAIQAAFGSSIDVGDRSVFGQINGILAERYALLWELLEAIYSTQDPDKAIGAALDAICLLTGTFRPAATFSIVTLTLTGTPTTLVSSNSRASTTSTSKDFQTTVNATITALAAWLGNTAYTVGVRVTNASRAYQCITAGTSAASGGPTTTASDITDGSGTPVHWTYLGEGTGAIDVVATAVESGEIAGVARDITTIETQISGWSSVINLLDADMGRDKATDEELRLLREAELAQAGTSTIDAIRAELIDMDDVISVTIFVNDTDTTNADGLPPHSVEALVRSTSPPPTGFDQTIFDALLANVAAGIQTYGTTSGTSTDSQGITHTIKFTHPTEINIYVYIIVTKDSATYPTDGNTQIKTAITDFGDLQVTGKDAVAASVSAQAFQVDGVLEVSAIGISTTSIATPTVWLALTAYSTGNVVTNVGRMYRCITSGTSASSGGPSTDSADITDGTAHWEFLGRTIAITLRQLAIFDSSRITVTSSTATP